MSMLPSSSSQLLLELNLPSGLLCRIHEFHGNQMLLQQQRRNPHATENKTFVLYLPTVNLRIDQNPAFAFACRLANYYQVPCIVLATVLDDHLLPSFMKEWINHDDNNDKDQGNNKMNPIVMTSRRLAFTLEALSEAGAQWSKHGCGVAIRVHGSQSRSPDHLTLSSRAMAVVNDEPFVQPYLNYVLQIEKTCKQAGVGCFRVDGSTTVPPVSVLKRYEGPASTHKDRMHYYTGVPAKAWLWQKQTEMKRLPQIHAAMGGEFDAPSLLVRLENDLFFVSGETNSSGSLLPDALFPSSWRNRKNEAPGSRPWSISELNSIHNIKEWSSTWAGADPSVEPCTQTLGTYKAGMRRWNSFVRDRKGLVYYARQRGDPKNPHASSRMSCYLNMGVVSIFRLVHEVKLAQNAKVAGADKFEEEIVKWREMSYAHAFSRSDYNFVSSIPKWAIQSIEQPHKNAHNQVTISNLEYGESTNSKWNAMQHYLIQTGELHNNVRMVWGKTVVEWLSSQAWSALKIIQTLNYLNDRFALDGLSPPSYAGINWCLGWCDKPDDTGGISKKPASRYSKITVEEFQDAAKCLYAVPRVQNQSSILTSLQSSIESSSDHYKRISNTEEDEKRIKKKFKTMNDFFQPR